MTKPCDKLQHPSADATETLLRLLVADRRRVARAEIEGRTVWIKRFDAEGPTLSDRLHRLVSPLLPLAFLRATRSLSPAGQMEREMRKMRAFREAGLAVADIVFRRDTTLVLSDAAEIVQKALWRMERAGEIDAHEQVLARCAEALATAHAAGLCHGRPHPRDMFLSGGRWGFIDFEEEPERAMPLATAQARDVWLIFLQICGQALKPETAGLALDLYRAQAPGGVEAELKTIVRTVAPILPLLRLLDHGALGKDGQRVLKATAFLRYALGSGRDSSHAEGASGTGGLPGQTSKQE